MKLEKGKKNLLEFSNSKVFLSRNMSLMEKKEKKNRIRKELDRESEK